MFKNKVHEPGLELDKLPKYKCRYDKLYFEGNLGKLLLHNEAGSYFNTGMGPVLCTKWGIFITTTVHMLKVFYWHL